MESFSEETKTKNLVSASIIFAVNYLEKKHFQRAHYGKCDF